MIQPGVLATGEPGAPETPKHCSVLHGSRFAMARGWGSPGRDGPGVMMRPPRPRALMQRRERRGLRALSIC
eukprot:751546-Hanusia_phi.AAC.6